MTKTPVKFPKDQLRTVGVDAHTRQVLLQGGGRNHEITELRKAQYYVPSLFFEKAGDNKYGMQTLVAFMDKIVQDTQILLQVF